MTDTPNNVSPAAALEGVLDTARQSSDGRLPPERDLAVRYGLSRTAVRRWLDGLERSGTIVRHVGRGTFLTPTVEIETSPSQIMAVRLLLEPQMLSLAVANARSSDIAEMRRCLAAGAAAADFVEFERWDSRLHATIATSTDNPLLLQLFNVMNDARDNPVWGNAKRRSFTPQRRAEYQQDHEALVDAIENRDTETAVAVMREHLSRIRTTLLGV